MDKGDILDKLLQNKSSYETVIQNYIDISDLAKATWKSSDFTLNEIAECMDIGIHTLKYRIKSKSFKPLELKGYFDALYQLTLDKNEKEGNP